MTIGGQGVGAEELEIEVWDFAMEIRDCVLRAKKAVDSQSLRTQRFEDYTWDFSGWYFS